MAEGDAFSLNAAASAAEPVSTGCRLVPVANLRAEWQREAAEAYDARVNGRPRGPVTGLPKLDDAIGGALQPGLHVLHGEPGAGKSCLALQIAVSCQCPALFVTCEMAPLELLRRIAARVTGTYLGRLKSGELDPRASDLLARRAIDAARQLAFLDGTEAFVPAEFLERAAIVTRGDSSHLLIVVDSVHSWAEAASASVTEYDALNAGLAALRAISTRMACPILAIAERNRASMKAGGMSASAGSRRFEYGAATVLDLAVLEPDATPDVDGEVAIDVTIRKNRHGAAGRKIALRFHGALQRFREA